MLYCRCDLLARTTISAQARRLLQAKHTAEYRKLELPMYQVRFIWHDTGSVILKVNTQENTLRTAWYFNVRARHGDLKCGTYGFINLLGRAFNHTSMIMRDRLVESVEHESHNYEKYGRTQSCTTRHSSTRTALPSLRTHSCIKKIMFELKPATFC